MLETTGEHISALIAVLALTILMGILEELDVQDMKYIEQKQRQEQQQR